MAKKETQEFEPFVIDKDSIVKGTSNGYYYCTTTPPHPYGEKRSDRKKKYIYLHRALLEQKLGRYLMPNEQADHKDGDKENNSKGNVTLKDLGEHQHDHAMNGNSFWKKSPRNKKRANEILSGMALRVLQRFFNT